MVSSIKFIFTSPVTKSLFSSLTKTATIKSRPGKPIVRGSAKIVGYICKLFPYMYGI